MTTFIWVVLIFTGIEVVAKVCLLAIGSWPKPDKFSQVLDVCVNMTMAAWAIALLAKGAA